MVDEPDWPITEVEVARWPIGGMTASEVRIMTFDIQAGVHAPPHDHGGWQFVYVMEGSVVSTIQGQPPAHFGPGQAFYIPRGAAHIDFGNDGEGMARTLSFFLSDPGVPMVTPRD